MAPSLRTLSRQERFYLDTLTNMKRFADNYNADRDQGQLEGWKQRCETLYRDFEENRLKLEMLYDEDDEEGEDEEDSEDTKATEEANRLIRSKFELDYVVVYSFLTTELRKLNTVPQTLNQTIALANACPPTPLSRIKLPEVRLPTFDGSVSEWITFRDTFKSLIDSNPQLSPIDKFSYLAVSLTKDAKRVIESIEITAANYSIAWQLLEKRFDNKKLVVKNYIDALFSIDSMKRECYESLMRLIDDFERNLCMIDKVGIPTDGWGVILAHMVCRRLDSSTLKQWETHHKSTDVPTYTDLIAFLRTHLTVLQSLPPSKSRLSDPPKLETYRPQKSNIHTVHTVTSSATNSCPFCAQPPHSAFKCDVFQKLSVSQRFEQVKKKNLCINCLSPSHILRNCSSSSCRVCNQKHHTMLHQPSNDRSPAAPKPPTQTTPCSNLQATPQHNQTHSSNQSSSHFRSTSSSLPPMPSPSATASSLVPATASSLVSATLVGCTRSVPATVLLQTAVVKVFDSNGHMQWARALLDPASQLNLVTENLVQKLKLRRNPDRQEIGGVGNSVVVSYHTVSVRLRSHCSEFTIEENFHILKKITQDLPVRCLDTSLWNMPCHIPLADPKFNEPGPIDLLLGMEMYYDLLLDGFSKLGPEQPVLQNTVFGWVASGRVGSTQITQTAPKVTHVCSTPTLDDQLSRLWELESCWSNSILSVEETACEAYFAATTFRDETGRFVVTLPKRPEVLSQLGNSKEIATRRFLALERRLQANPEMKKSYSAFIDEYHQLNHMQQISDTENSTITSSYYLPHHGVEKADSTTTKLRVVFDASCRTDSGVSLNQGLIVGPVVQDDLFAILLRFRMHRFAIIADIEKMYRQIRVHPVDCPLQRILWRGSSSEPLRTFQLTTVTYGTASAPYLATKCLQELAKQGMNDFPLASCVLAKDYYVDDMLTGVDDEEGGEELCRQLLQLLQSAGFTQRKWASNSATILSKIPAELRDERTVFDLDSPSSPIKTLGLQWEPSADLFKYAVLKWADQDTLTRRIVLSDTARLYDPLGLIGPVVVLAKIFIQTLWRSTKQWDDPLNDAQQQYWFQFRSSLNDLSSISIPRWVALAHEPVSVELHGFCDASEKAYGACIYVRTVSRDGTISVRLIAAKSKVAPLGDSKKQRLICLPRLELSSALLLSHLYDKVEGSIGLKTRALFWTDSKITHYWVTSTPSRWKKFIATRSSEVQHLTAGGVWAHVPGIENPADIISRGMHPADLRDSSMWWIGPPWLSQPSRFWPPLTPTKAEEVPVELLEERPISLAIHVAPPNEIFSLRSSFSALVRIVALLRRFSHNAKPQNHTNRKIGIVWTTELDDAIETLVQLAQREVFTRDIAAILADGQVKRNSDLINLSPIIVNGILRVGGRLKNAAISYDRKHPMILPARHPLTECILVYYHLKNLHAGPQLLVACVRERFWPLRIRNLARHVVHTCINCFRCKPRVLEQLMGDLPIERVTPTWPFLNTGVDLCGPFQYRVLGKAAPVKCFVAIFVCLVTKAVHVELVCSQSTASFLSALHRFIARRGKPKLIECDNAGNFKGAARELAELSRQFYSQQHQTTVVNRCADDGIEFKFIPPRSPNFGGLWEAAVKSLKQHLRATIGNSILIHDDFVTLLARIEACLNSRPLTPLSADPNDLEVLTPGHFLVHRALTSYPEPDLSEIPRNRLDRWQANQELLRRIWKRWTIDYLSGLHPRTKWTQRRDNISIGTMVLLKEDNLPPLKWRYGRVTQIFRGDDNNIRVVNIRTIDGEFRRSISKVCVLPVHQPPTHGPGDASLDLDEV